MLNFYGCRRQPRQQETDRDHLADDVFGSSPAWPASRLGRHWGRWGRFEKSQASILGNCRLMYGPESAFQKPAFTLSGLFVVGASVPHGLWFADFGDGDVPPRLVLRNSRVAVDLNPDDDGARFASCLTQGDGEIVPR